MPRTDDWFSEPDDLQPTSETWDFPLERRRARKRIAISTTLVMLFFAGAAFTAVGGDLTATKLQSEECSQQANTADVADTTTCDAQAADASAMAAAPDAAPAADPAGTPDAAAPATSAPAEAAPEATPAPATDGATATPDDTEPQAANVGSTHKAPSQPTFRSHAVRPINATTNVGGSAGPSGKGNASAKRVEARALPVLAPPASFGVPLRNSTRLARGTVVPPKPEIEHHDGIPTIWLNRELPDPTPPAKRLRLAFAAKLAKDAKKAGVDWALVLGVLRASGESGSVPASNVDLQRLTSRLAANGAARNKWQAVLRMDGHTEFADQALALARYNRAVGLWALVHGLEAAKPALTQKVLKDPKITIYTGGRSDLDLGRVDVRVIALIAYLRQTFGQVTVSCLISGHRLYARPGVISRHIYGLAVDIASVGGTTILGHQQQGSVTETAVRDILLLPSELQPQQVISLIGLGGPSFPLANHFDHIHVGY